MRPCDPSFPWRQGTAGEVEEACEPPERSSGRPEVEMSDVETALNRVKGSFSRSKEPLIASKDLRSELASGSVETEVAWNPSEEGSPRG